MKNSHIAYWVAALGAVMFLYQIHQISGLEQEAAVWEAQAHALENPGAGTYFKAFFDGFTLGAFSNGNIFSEYDKSVVAGNQLEAQRASILSRYQDATSYRNWGLIIGVGGIVAALIMRKKAPDVT